MAKKLPLLLRVMILLSQALVASLIEDAGFEAVDIGTLAESRPIDPPSAIWNKVLTANEIRDRVA